MKNTTTLPVRFRAQGAVDKHGCAIGRKGKALLIQYFIQTGEARERWIPGKRIIELTGDIDTLPRWRSRSCPAVSFGQDLDYSEARSKASDCPKCGDLHQLAYATRTRDLSEAEVAEYLAARKAAREHYAAVKHLPLLERDGGPRHPGHLYNVSVSDGVYTQNHSVATGTSSLKLPDELVEEKPEPEQPSTRKDDVKPAPKRQPKPKHATREQWLQAGVKALRPLFTKVCDDDQRAVLKKLVDKQKLRVSCGWPGGGSARTRIGECWSETCSADGKIEIFISPKVAEKVEVLDILTHEIVHAVVGLECGHKGAFRSVATKVGLQGKMTATTAGPELNKQLKAIAKKLGTYPHAKLDLSDRKKQTTRMVKCSCKECGYVCRTTRKWLEELGAPFCPGCKEQMEND